MKLLVLAVVLGTILPTGLSTCQTIQTTETIGTTYDEIRGPALAQAVRKVICVSTEDLTYSAEKDTPESVKGIRKYNNWRKTFKCSELKDVPTGSK